MKRRKGSANHHLFSRMRQDRRHCMSRAGAAALSRERPNSGAKERPGRAADGERHHPVRRKVGPVTNVRRVIAVALIASLGWSLECSAAPPLQKQTTPTPPRRPPQPLEEQQTAPPNARGTEGRETTRVPGPANPTGSKTPAAPHDAEPAFPSLPAASRARMRDCGHEWQEMKRTGQAKALTWRDFATQCLTR